ncbi:MAG: DUF4339 domain-containing protein [Muribaculaceae bacterium]|nr:DUF4339 domain-containing protein [Muribaculaceae bacterium]
MKEFFVIVNGQQQGPFTVEQLAELAITPETEVWCQGMDDWKQAGDVPELTSLLQQLQFQHHMDTTPPPYTPHVKAEAAAPTATSAPSAWTEPEPEQPQPQPKRGSGCGTKLLLALLIVVILGGILAVTCPSRQDHKDAVASSSREWLDQKLRSDDQQGGFASILKGVFEWVSGKGIDYAIDEYLDVDNYFVFSVGRIRIGDSPKTVSLGVLNHVFTFDKDDVDRFLLDAIKSKVGLGGTQAPPPVVTPPSEDEDDSYLAPPVEDDSLAEDRSNPAEELLDSLATQAKRQAIKTAKEWAKKQIDRLGQ